MRRAILFLTFLLTSTANSYEINLEGEKPLHNCQISASEKTFLCTDNKGAQFFIKEAGFEFIAFKKTKDGKFEEKEVFEIYETEGEVTYMKPLSRGDMFYSQGETYFRGDMAEFANGISNIHRRFFEFMDPDEEVTKDDNKKIYDFVEDFKKDYSTRKKHYESLMSSKLNVQLDNGEKLSCQRAPGKKAASCNLLDCGKDKLGNKVLLLKDRTSDENSFTSFAYDKNGNHAKNSSRVKGIYSSLGQTLLEINSELEKGVPFKHKMLVPGEYHKNPALFDAMMMPNVYYMLEDEFANCSPKMLWLLQNQAMKAGELLRDAEMVQLIEFVNKDIKSNFVNIETLPDYACVHNGIYYSPEGYQKLKEYKGQSSKKTISMKQAQKLHDKARARDDIAWDYTYDGCYARAHLMARMFEDEDIHVDKAWLRGRLQIPGEADGKNWGYHVAPLVYVEDANGKVQEMIIDPSISEKPLTPDEWAGKMEVFFDDSEKVAFPTPTNTANFGKTTYAVTNSDPYWPELDTTLTEEMKVQMAKDTMEQYLSGIDPWEMEWQKW